MKDLIAAQDGIKRPLTKAERKLLMGFGEIKGPETITEICQKQGVSRKTYYKLINDPEFRQLLPEALNYVIGQQLIPLVSVVIRKGMEGSAKHAELTFKLAGLLGSDEGQKILQVFQTGETPGEPFLTSEAIQRMINRGKKK